jgi:hypothetical protein
MVIEQFRTRTISKITAAGLLHSLPLVLARARAQHRGARARNRRQEYTRSDIL